MNIERQTPNAERRILQITRFVQTVPYPSIVNHQS
jgi:hypothetical protein